MPWHWHWRPITWVVLAWILLLPVWFSLGMAHLTDICAPTPHVPFPCNALLCPFYANPGGVCAEPSMALTFGVFVALLAGVFVATPLLGVRWFRTRPRRLQCRECGKRLHRGVTLCPTCHLEALPPTVEGHAVRSLR